MDIAIDGGFGYFKFYDGSNTGVVRSAYRKVSNDYEIGDRVLSQPNPKYLRTVDELVEMYPIFIREIIKTNERIDRLAVGLPLNDYNRAITLLTSGKDNHIYRLITSLSLLAKEVMVYPQGLGLIKAYLSESRDNITGNILAIDIGFNTVIVALYSVESKEILFSKTYYRHGVSSMVAMLEGEIEVKDKTLTPQDLDYILRQGRYNSGLDAVDISEVRDRVSNDYVSELLRTVIGDIKTTLGVAVFGTILFGGGGAVYLNGVSASKTRIVKIADPQFANVRGFYYKLVGA